jgi:phosphoribosyl-ATP pyrophosphohydrolase
MPDDDLSVLNEVYDVIRDRKLNPVEGSYVCSLLNHRKGINKILEKVGEEAIETILAVKEKEKGQSYPNRQIYIPLVGYVCCT